MCCFVQGAPNVGLAKQMRFLTWMVSWTNRFYSLESRLDLWKSFLGILNPENTGFVLFGLPKFSGFSGKLAQRSSAEKLAHVEKLAEITSC